MEQVNDQCIHTSSKLEGVAVLPPPLLLLHGLEKVIESRIALHLLVDRVLLLIVIVAIVEVSKGLVDEVDELGFARLEVVDDLVRCLVVCFVHDVFSL